MKEVANVVQKIWELISRRAMKWNVQDHEGISGKFSKENPRMPKGFQADAGTGSSEVHCNGSTEVRSGVFSEFFLEVDHAQELGMIPEEMSQEKSRGRIQRLNTFGDGLEVLAPTWKHGKPGVRYKDCLEVIR